jgi:hypothetical protein
MHGRKNAKPREALAELAGAVDSEQAMGSSIRQAFLTHMGEQQRQFAAAAPPSIKPGAAKTSARVRGVERR